MSNTTASIITIGDELLIGQTIDTNSAWIAQKLNVLGIDVIRRLAVKDNFQAIWNALDEERRLSELIFITGGLGPTSDDITKPLLCKYFGGQMIVDTTVLNHIKRIFERLKRPVIERNLKQAEVPDNCRVLFNRMGTAPGMWFEDQGNVFVAMPGVPFEMMAIMEDGVLPELEKRVCNSALIHKTVVTAGEGESFIAERLVAFEAALPSNVNLAYLPDTSIVRIRLTGRGDDKTIVENQLELLQKSLVEKLGNIVVATEDIPMEKVLANALIPINKTIGIAESCTGGFIGHAITQIPGASSYFAGSIVSYDNRIKEQILGVKPATLVQFGAVSEQTATEMARGALHVLGVDFALATTGVLGPGGGTDKVDVGTVWMAVANSERIITRMFRFRYDRQRNKEQAAKMGMLLLWKFITGRI